jgi:hypothetical protein
VAGGAGIRKTINQRSWNAQARPPRLLAWEQHVAAHNQAEPATLEMLEGDALAQPEALDPEDGVEFRVHGPCSSDARTSGVWCESWVKLIMLFLVTVE